MDEDIRALALAGRKIEAIKVYRERYGVGLAAAKDAVEEMVGGGPVTPPPPPDALSYAQDEQSFDQQIDALLRANDKIEAIRRYRERYGVGLKDAKDAIDSRARAPLRPQGPAPAAPLPRPPTNAPAAGPEPLIISPVPGAPGRAPLPSNPAAAPSLPPAPPAAAPPRPAPGGPAGSGRSAPSSPSAAETQRMDRNLGQGIDLALQTGRRDEAVQLYQQRYRVSRQEAERVIDGRASQIHANSGRSGCFIATAAYGGAELPEVALLRRYRDAVLSRSGSGRALIRCYYRISPPLAAAIRRSDTARRAVRRLLAPVVASCRKALHEA